MRVRLKLVLNCQPDAAWAAIARPEAFRAVSAPLATFESLTVAGFPDRWTPGLPHPVALRLFGAIPIGTQTIDVAFTERRNGVRMMTDSGHALSGPLAVIDSWDHRMAISATADGRTLYRDQLSFSAGAVTPLVWVGLWLFWQWRAIGLTRAARSWRVRL
ncbi:hypothetical protein [Salinibacterium sp. ZJ454]|uniref:hypothetical protein n=1 Tax=Salinibacterium sp. ZJ454 TaxID=2708339 RepID=UPI001420F1AD|nr:hypothetical protein [Salinibacterium sp. ZJ454]